MLGTSGKRTDLARAAAYPHILGFATGKSHIMGFDSGDEMAFDYIPAWLTKNAK